MAHLVRGWHIKCGVWGNTFSGVAHSVGGGTFSRGVPHQGGVDFGPYFVHGQRGGEAKVLSSLKPMKLQYYFAFFEGSEVKKRRL